MRWLRQIQVLGYYVKMPWKCSEALRDWQHKPDIRLYLSPGLDPTLHNHKTPREADDIEQVPPVVA